MSTKFTHLAIVVSVVAGFSTSVFAIDPQSIRVSDGVMFTPSIQLLEGHDSNIYSSNKKPKSSMVTMVEPSFKLSLDRAKSAHQLKYRMVSTSFHSSSSNNHVDHHVTADTGIAINSRNRLRLNAGYHKLQDVATGSVRRGENDKWNIINIGGLYTYGAQTARAQIDLSMNYNQLRYDNSGLNSSGQRINKENERDSASAGVVGYYSISPKTKLLLESRYINYDYKSDSMRDSNNKGLLAGVVWEAAAKTKGSVKVGAEKKDYTSSGTLYKNTSTGMWEVGVTWAPLTYSTFNLKSRRSFDEGSYTEFNSFGDESLVSSNIRTVDSSLSWKHYWMERLYSDAQYRYIDRKYENVTRDDKIDQIGLGLTYQARRWLDIRVGFIHRENKSSNLNSSYKRNLYGLTFNASL